MSSSYSIEFKLKCEARSVYLFFWVVFLFLSNCVRYSILLLCVSYNNKCSLYTCKPPWPLLFILFIPYSCCCCSKNGLPIFIQHSEKETIVQGKEGNNYVCVCVHQLLVFYKPEFCISFWKMAQLIDCVSCVCACVFVCERMWCQEPDVFFFSFSFFLFFLPFYTHKTLLADGFEY